MFKVGDVVKLRSGGPAMTIDDITDENECVCQWFGEKEKLERAVFDPKTLKSFDGPIIS